MRLSVTINGRLPSPAKYTEYREEREAANTFFSNPVRTITTSGGYSILHSQRRSAEMREERQGEPLLSPGVRQRGEYLLSAPQHSYCAGTDLFKG